MGSPPTTPPRPMRGANGSVAGAAGYAPAPAAADNVKYLKGDGTWSALANPSAATDAEAAAGTSTTTFATPANVALAAAKVANPRAPRQALVMSADGSGLARAGTWTFGTSDFTLHFNLYTDSTTNSAQRIFFYGADEAASVNIRYNPSTRTFSSANSGLTYVAPNNKPAHYVYVRSSLTATLYRNGIAVQSGFADSTNYISGTYLWGGNGVSAGLGGVYSGLNIFNRALSAAEVLALYERGVPAAADYNSAGQAISNGTFAGTGVSGGSASGFTFSHASGQYVTSSLGGASALRVGQRIRFSGTLTGTGTISAVYIDSTGATGGVALTAGAFTMDLTCGTSPTTTGLVLYCDAGSNLTMSGVTITRIGLLCAPEANAPGNGVVWNDQSGNGAHLILPVTGTVWALPDNRVNRIRSTTKTNGNQQLLATTTLLPANKLLVLRVRARARSGTPSVTVGNGSGLSNIVATVALTTAWKTLTLASADFIPTTDSPIWIGSNSTDVIEWDIAVEPLSY